MGSARYTPAVDVWGAGLIVAELFTGRPVLRGDDLGDLQACDIDQYLKICELCGTPTASSWPSFNKLKDAGLFTPKRQYHRTLTTTWWRSVEDRYTGHFAAHSDGAVRARAQAELDAARQALVAFFDDVLVMNPEVRLTARDALLHDVFFVKEAAPSTSDELARALPQHSCHEYNERKQRHNAGRGNDNGGGGSAAKRAKKVW